MSQIVKERGGFINRLEKEENADVFINETLDKVSLIHGKYGKDIQKHIKPISLRAFCNFTSGLICTDRLIFLESPLCVGFFRSEF